MVDRVLSVGVLDNKIYSSGLPFNFGGIIRGFYSETSLSSGQSNHNVATVPSGELWVITNVLAYIVGGTIDPLIVRVIVGAFGYELLRQANPANDQSYGGQRFVILDEGNIIQARVENAAAGNDLFVSFMGYKMLLDQK